MDIRCPKCREPWDHDTLHDEVTERKSLGQAADYEKVAAEFRSKGCGVAFAAFMGQAPADCTPAGGADPELSALADLLGDDMDGYAAMSEDLAR